MNVQPPVMPDLSRPRHSFRHTLGSALEVLASLNVPADRVNLEMAGPGWPTGQVIRQVPTAGTILSVAERITLTISGSGLLAHLPGGMRDAGAETEMGLNELVGLFDDPFQKLAHWIENGARLFDISRRNHQACARWLALFGVAADDWPAKMHYELAILMPSLHSLAGKENGMRFIFHHLLGLPLHSIRRAPAYLNLARDIQSRLGGELSRLSVDMIAGSRLEDLAQWTLVFGPITVQTYFQFRDSYYGRLLEAVAAFALPAPRRFGFAWNVLDPRRPVQLGHAHRNGVLGVNSHLGRTPYEWTAQQSAENVLTEIAL